MVDGGDLHAGLKETNAVRLQRHRQEVKVRGIAQQILMNAQIVGNGAVGAQPHLTHRLGDMAFHRVMKLHRADLQRLIAEEFVFHLRRQEMRQLAGNVGFRRQPIRGGGGRHRFLMFIAVLWRLEGGGHIEDRLPVLDGGDPAGAKAVAVAQHLHIVDDRFLTVAGAQKVAVKRMHQTFNGHGLFCRIQRLAHHLAAKNLAQSQVFALSTEQPFLNFFQI